ncbi:hypothetical protein GBA52_008077 [Prunus armeniaca]|nr:hypothetical protein GBA52_008077 [Prunus armeniaca]
MRVWMVMVFMSGAGGSGEEEEIGVLQGGNDDINISTLLMVNGRTTLRAFHLSQQGCPCQQLCSSKVQLRVLNLQIIKEKIVNLTYIQKHN